MPRAGRELGERVVASASLEDLGDDVGVQDELAARLSSTGTPLYGLEVTQVLTSDRSRPEEGVASALSPLARDPRRRPSEIGRAHV